MEHWWHDIDNGILECLAGNGSMSPQEVGERLGLSEAAVISAVCMLAQEGRIRIDRIAPHRDAELGKGIQAA